MCLLYRNRTSRAEIARIFQTNRLEGPEELEKDYVSPGRAGWLITSAGLLTTRPFCRPHWQHGKQPIGNIRNLSSNWGHGFLNDPAHRCLVPLTQFSEWPDHTQPGAKRAPVWFRHSQLENMAFAGIFHEGWFAFLTCEPNAEVGAVHKKAMPVILNPTDGGVAWLEGAPAADLQAALPDNTLVTA